MTAAEFEQRLLALASPEERAKVERYFKTTEGDTFAGVAMRDVLKLAKEFSAMEPAELERLLESPVHEARAGALSIMGTQAKARRTGEQRRRELYELYLRRTDRIDNWDLVDISAHHVVGGYLVDRPRDPLYALARSNNPWERRIAMFATLAFTRRGQLDDTFALAEVLLHDEEDLVQKVVGGLLREAGKTDRARLVAFLDRHAARMPRTTLRYASEHLDPEERARLRAL